MHIKDGESLPVLPSVEPVISQSGSVFFHPDRLGPAVAQWGALLGPYSGWEPSVHYMDNTKKTVRWVFTLDILNHCFWPDNGKPTWEATYRGESYSGYYGLAASLKRAVEEGFPITDAGYLKDIPPEDLRAIFSGAGEIPLFEARLANLREAGAVLLSEWKGDVVSLVEKAQGSAVRLARLVSASFPSFRDQAEYESNTVYFWKRAQIFAADLHLTFGGKKWGRFHDMDQLTAFADYKLPQVFRELGIISYHPELAARIDRREMLVSGGKEEVEIRAMTIWAVESLRGAFRQTGREANSMQIDNWLWRLGQLEPFRQRPYHRCRTAFY
jgi:hypothetical protein